MVPERGASLILLNLALVACVIPVYCSSYTIHLNTSAPVLQQVDQTFLSTTIEISQLYIEGRHCNFTSPRLINLASELLPIVLRVGGTRGDTFYYDMSPDPLVYAPPPYETVFTAADYQQACTLASQLGTQIAFGVNAGEGPRANSSTGAWTPYNLEDLLQYSLDVSCPLIGFEFGNEPNLYPFKFGSQATVSPSQYAQDFLLFKQTIKSYNPKWIAIAPDIDYAQIIGVVRPGWDQQFLAGCGSEVDSYTWHFYPLISNYSYAVPPFEQFLVANPEKYLDPLVLNQVNFWGKRVVEKRDKYAPQAQIWLGETGSAVGGGVPGISDRFVDGIEWLDKLGQLSRLGVGTVMRQTLCDDQTDEYSYGLISYDLTPHPSYWAAVLFKRYISNEVLSLSRKEEPDNGKWSLLRSYAFCAKEGAQISTTGSNSTLSNGAVTMILINLDVEEVTITIDGVSNAEEGYLFSMTSGSLSDDYVKLNGQILLAQEDGLPPPMLAVSIELSNFTLSPTSYAFLVIPDAAHSACISSYHVVSH